MAGFVGNARQWRKFEKRAAKLFGRFRVDVFHSIDLKRSDKDFAGWSVDRKIEFIDELNHIANECLERGFVAILRDEDWEFYKNLDWPRKARREPRYTLMFRAIMAFLVRGVMKSPSWNGVSEPHLRVVLESGHKNAPDAVRLYNFMREYAPRANRALSGLTFESKSKCLPLAAADMLAYGAYVVEAGGKPIGVAKKPMKTDASYKHNFERLVINRPTLVELHQQAKTIAALVSASRGRSS